MSVLVANQSGPAAHIFCPCSGQDQWRTVLHAFASNLTIGRARRTNFKLGQHLSSVGHEAWKGNPTYGSWYLRGEHLRAQAQTYFVCRAVDIVLFHLLERDMLFCHRFEDFEGSKGSHGHRHVPCTRVLSPGVNRERRGRMRFRRTDSFVLWRGQGGEECWPEMWPVTHIPCVGSGVSKANTLRIWNQPPLATLSCIGCIYSYPSRCRWRPGRVFPDPIRRQRDKTTGSLLPSACRIILLNSGILLALFAQ